MNDVSGADLLTLVVLAKGELLALAMRRQPLIHEGIPISAPIPSSLMVDFASSSAAPSVGN
jgi:hypothetical protein